MLFLLFCQALGSDESQSGAAVKVENDEETGSIQVSAFSMIDVTEYEGQSKSYKPVALLAVRHLFHFFHEL